MNLCPRHLELVLEAIEERGMSSLLVNKNEAELRWEFAAEDSGFYPETFDPLLAIKYVMVRRTADRMIEHAKDISVDMDGCFICVFDVPQWIEDCAESVRGYVDSYQLLG